MTTSVHHKIAQELDVGERQVLAAVELLDGGATVPFVARYRKEATDGLDDTHRGQFADILAQDADGIRALANTEDGDPPRLWRTPNPR